MPGPSNDTPRDGAADIGAQPPPEWWQVTLSSIGDAVITTDTGGRVTYMNPVAETLTGWMQTEALGVPLTSVFLILNEQTRKTVDNPVARVLRDGVTVGLANHTVLVARHGGEHPIDDSAAPIRDAQGTLLGVVLIFRDVGAQRHAQNRLRESEARKTAMLETALDCIITMDHRGDVVEFNAAAERTFGHRRADVIGRPLADLIIPMSLRDQHHKGLARYLATGEGPVLGRRVELPALRADGTEFPVELAITRIPAEGPPLFTAYLRDISGRVRGDQLRGVRLAVTQHLTHASTIGDALEGLLAAVCEHLRWDVGRFWTVDAGAGVITPKHVWHSPGLDESWWGAASSSGGFSCGDGLPGRVWATARPAWTLDAHDAPAIARAPSAHQLHGALACPIVVGDVVVGAIEFLAHHLTEPEPDLLETMTTIAGYAGQFMERRQAEDQLRQNERELTDFFDNATIGLHWVGADGTILRANRAELEMLGYAPAEYVGHNIAEYHVDGAVSADILQRLRSGAALRDFPSRMRCKDGSVRDVLIDSSVRFADGRFQYARSFTRDITDRKRVEEALQESEARFRGLMEQAPFSVQVFTPDGRLIQVNRAWSQLWGTTLDEIPDYNLLEDPQLEQAGIAHDLRRAFAGEAVTLPTIRYDPNVTLPDRTHHADPVRWVSAVAYPLTDDGGRVREVVVVQDDVTARVDAEHALRDSEARLGLLADTIPQLAWMAQPDGRITWYNRQWYAYTGTTPEDMEGWGWQSVHDADVLPVVLERWRASIASGEPFEMVFPLRGADGRYRPFLTRVNPLHDARGQVLYWFGTNTDISDIKRMEDALRDADRRKDEFLATLAHELRNPLAPIRNGLQILKTPGVDAATVQQTRDMMDRQVHHLVRLVDDLLDVSRVMRGKIELRKERVELATIVARAVEIAQPLMEVHGHDLDRRLPDHSLLVSVDPVRLTQVVGNVLTNAAKFTEAHGRIQVEARREGAQALLHVRDTGTGIAPDLLPHVFELFVQGHHAGVHPHGGLGIGLTLVRSLVALHEGTVDIRSAGVGHGVEVTIRLPLATEPQAPPGDPVDASAASATDTHRLLVVDDNHDSADSLALLLQMQGHDVRVAYDGPSALDAALEWLPDLVLLDLGMPLMDGYEVARRLRTMDALDGMVIAALTGWGQDSDRQRSAAAGFDHHLVKPVQPGELDALVASLTSRRRPGGDASSAKLGASPDSRVD